MPLKTDQRFVNMDLDSDNEPNEAYWLSRIERHEDGTVDAEKVIERQHSALEALETASDVHPLGPSVLILRSKGKSYREIAEKLHMARQTAESIHKKVSQVVIGKKPS